MAPPSFFDGLDPTLISPSQAVMIAGFLGVADGFHYDWFAATDQGDYGENVSRQRIYDFFTGTPSGGYRALRECEAAGSYNRVDGCVPAPCPSGVVTAARIAGYGDFVRAGSEFFEADDGFVGTGAGAALTTGVAEGAQRGLTEIGETSGVRAFTVLGRLLLPVAVSATAVDALCAAG